MATIKAYTTIEQSRKLTEILPLESADMYYSWIGTAYLLHAESYNEIIAWRKEYAKTHNNPSFCTSIIPCWSLAALLSVLPDYTLQTNTDGTVFVVCDSKKPMISDAYDNPVDACVAMIEKLNELKML